MQVARIDVEEVIPERSFVTVSVRFETSVITTPIRLSDTYEPLQSRTHLVYVALDRIRAALIECGCTELEDWRLPHDGEPEQLIPPLAPRRRQ